MFLKPGHYKSYSCHNDSDSAANQVKSLDSCILLTCGSKGEEMIQKVYHCPGLMGIVIFTMNKNRPWLSKYSDKILLISTSPSEVFSQGIHSLPGLNTIVSIVSEAKKSKQQIIDSHMSKTVPTFGGPFQKPPSMLDAECEQFVKLIDTIKFHSVPGKGAISIPDLKKVIQSQGNKILLHRYKQQLKKKKSKNSSKGVQTNLQNKTKFDEMVSISLKQNPVPATKVFKYLLTLSPSKQSQLVTQTQKNNWDLSNPVDLLSTFCLYYTGNALYNQLKNTMKEYEMIYAPELTATLISSIQKAMKIDKNIQVDPYTKLFRGEKVKFQDEGKPVYFWPGFSSTSVEKHVAISFSGGMGTVYSINLDSKKPHDHIKIFDSVLKSEYAGQKQVLLLPMFGFQVGDIQKKTGSYDEISISEKKT